MVQERIIKDDPQKGSGSLVLAIFFVLLLAAVIVAMYFYYRRRVANLKTEVERAVQYIADPNGSTLGKLKLNLYI